MRQIKAAAAKTLLDRGDAVLIDVREPDEHAQERIEGARLAPLSRFDQASLEGERQLRQNEKNARCISASEGNESPDDLSHLRSMHGPWPSMLYCLYSHL